MSAPLTFTNLGFSEPHISIREAVSRLCEAEGDSLDRIRKAGGDGDRAIVVLIENLADLSLVEAPIHSARCIDDPVRSPLPPPSRVAQHDLHEITPTEICRLIVMGPRASNRLRFRLNDLDLYVHENSFEKVLEYERWEKRIPDTSPREAVEYIVTSLRERQKKNTRMEVIRVLKEKSLIEDCTKGHGDWIFLSTKSVFSIGDVNNWRNRLE